MAITRENKVLRKHSLWFTRPSSAFAPEEDITMRSSPKVWMFQVKVDTLAAHLEAYLTTRSTLDTLRLCNRFGQGDSGITKLPIELLEHIEQYFVEDEQETFRPAWAEDLALQWAKLMEWKNSGPANHYLAYHGENSPRHVGNSKRVQNLEKLGKTLSKDFGLRIGVEHVEWVAAERRWWCQSRSIVDPTKAFLLLPCSAKADSPLLARFGRAVKKLKLEVVHNEKPDSENQSGEMDEMATVQVSGDEGNSDAATAAAAAGALRMVEIKPELQHWPMDR